MQLPVTKEQQRNQMIRDMHQTGVQLAKSLERLEKSSSQLLASVSQSTPQTPPKHLIPTVLFVTSDIDNGMLLQQHLLNSYSVTFRLDIYACLAYLAQHHPFTIIIDAERVDCVNVFEATALLQEATQTYPIPIVYIDRTLNVKTRLRLLDAGITDYFVKPLRLESIARRIPMFPRMQCVSSKEP